MRLSAKIEPRDAWIGLFWDRKPEGLQIVVCPVPFLAVTPVLPVLAKPRRTRCEVCGDVHDLGEPDCLEWP
jgi:hypothetical protein